MGCTSLEPQLRYKSGTSREHPSLADALGVRIQDDGRDPMRAYDLALLALHEAQDPSSAIDTDSHCAFARRRRIVTAILALVVSALFALALFDNAYSPHLVASTR